jgi:hypothetical protein
MTRSRSNGLGYGLQAFGDADRIDQHEAGLGFRIRGHLAQLFGTDGPRATTLHLLEIEFRFHIAQEDQHLERFHVRAGRDHVDGDRDARIVVVAEGADQRFRIGAVGAIGDLFGEVVAFAEDFPQEPDDLLGMMVVLGEDRKIGDVARRLLGKTRERDAFRLGLDNAAELAADEQRVIDRPGCGRKLADCDS